jgi:hypothetical protein
MCDELSCGETIDEVCEHMDPEDPPLYHGGDEEDDDDAN